MGKVIIKIKLTNLFDLGAQHRKLSTAKPREVETEALADTGATRLYLKPSVIHALGLEQVDRVIWQTSNGPANRAKSLNNKLCHRSKAKQKSTEK
jgi:hypothetical protein